MKIFFRVFFLILFLTAAVSAFAKPVVKFGVPAWPGVTVKSEVAAQILKTMGYETEQSVLSAPAVFESLKTNNLDAYLAGWSPQEDTMINPLKEKGEIKLLGTNLDEGRISLCVPTYVWEAGVKSFADLDKYAEKFEHKIYNLQPGTGMNNQMTEIIANDVAGLGDWTQVESSTPAMLATVRAQMRQNKWVTFGCWKPHWMNVILDVKYLEGVPGTEKFVSKSVVYTIVRKGLKEDYPEVYKFLDQIKVNSELQSKWIYEFGYKKRAPEDVAKEWIGGNLDIVEKWLKGVKTVDGEPAAEVLRNTFAK
ncbi:ABC-type glycine betaine transport, periplasmic subunit [Flexistipes sinusarabici DSM 4947]|uniref:ABC-type glycine betaine transport, periplasmic subunit n=1 Tax=Flexistipes sinusarabici (strain ATCC 49648 / DSM 4947 / MAS 10) TaxID=717231 RepID=F8E7L6_FLESM|nr:ABC transporter substrate-binding protein [Flexistipes sinusarabici]AEI13861.1 ABC-type glycine betaine transport, periplasmic subunit [Flexistipes sinusarabici DSM 4947]